MRIQSYKNGSFDKRQFDYTSLIMFIKKASFDKIRTKYNFCIYLRVKIGLI